MLGREGERERVKWLLFLRLLPGVMIKPIMGGIIKLPEHFPPKYYEQVHLVMRKRERGQEKTREERRNITRERERRNMKEGKKRHEREGEKKHNERRRGHITREK